VPRHEPPEQLTVREALSRLTVEDLRPLAALLGQGGQGRKAEWVDRVATPLEDPEQVRALYGQLDDLGRTAVQEAAHDPEGVLHRERFRARYGRSPDFGGSGHYPRDPRPTLLLLFFPRYHLLPTDLRATLRTFVPRPEPFKVEGTEELPPKVKPPHLHLGQYHRPPSEEGVELRVRLTARSAQLEVKALLRLVDAGEVKVSEKTRRPGQAGLEAVGRGLVDGDFYADADRSEDSWDPASDLVMKPFAWPMILQAANLAEPAGGRLQLTAAGRKALNQPPHEVLRAAWQRWLKTTILDEYSRVSAVKGQQSSGSMTAVAPRRQAVVEGLKECPAGRWVTVEQLWRLLKASSHSFAVARDDWKLYIAEQHYGSLGYGDNHAWEHLQGRYALALLFEYAATLGLVDVAYIPPEDARNDFRDRWGTDDYSCLSRYDGLLFLRVNSLGAYCLGLADDYRPEAPLERAVLKVLPNLDVVVTDPPLGPADRLLLERFAEQTSDAVWHLGPAKVLAAVEEGLTVAELREFLAGKSKEPLPHTAEVFLDDLASRAGQLEDLGAARLIACKDAQVATLLAHDRKLRSLCRLAGERELVFRASDEAAVRRTLRELGYVLPPPR
jgi:hypothetical protein